MEALWREALAAVPSNRMASYLINSHAVRFALREAAARTIVVCPSKLQERSAVEEPFFITGTGCRRRQDNSFGFAVRGIGRGMYWKPIQTGTLEGSDRVTVMRLAGIGTDRTIDEVYKFVPPVSPDLARAGGGDGNRSRAHQSANELE